MTLVVGCGIDFSKRSVFFTKNGQIVSEHTHDHFGNELRELKALHAVVHCDFVESEWKVNFGATRFVFDIRKYQQLNDQTEGKLFSHTREYKY